MNTTEQEKSVENKKSGQKVANASSNGRASKTHPDYWRSRLVKHRDAKDYSVRIQHAGRREWFNTHSANATNAANTARRIYLDVVSLGWSASLAKHKPKPTVSAKIATVGEVIAEAGKIAAVRPATLATYAAALRRLAAELGDVKGPDPTAKFAYMRPEFAEYRARVDAVTVDTLTAGAVKEWKARRVAAKKTPVEQRAAAISCDTVIRSAAALFGEKVRDVLALRLNLPNPLPMAGVSYGKSTSRFKSQGVNPSWLFAKAREELEAQHPEQFKALTLCLLAGLRRAEADTLTWAQLELHEARVSIRTTDYFTPKSEESTREINLSPMAVDAMRQFKAGAELDPVFVLKGADAKPGARYKFYRADAPPWRTWRNLTAWLAAHGIEDQKAIHALRKHAGSLIYAAHGIEAARGFLGHGDIATTAASYLDRGRNIAVNLVPIADEINAGEKEASNG